VSLGYIIVCRLGAPQDFGVVQTLGSFKGFIYPIFLETSENDTPNNQNLKYHKRLK
jgi:hypothetical protein